MKNPFKSRQINQALLFIQFVITSVYGVVCIVDSRLSFAIARYLLIAILLINAFSRTFEYFSKKEKPLKSVLPIVIFCILSTMIFLPNLLAISVSKLFGIWFLISGIAQLTICIQCITLNLRGKFRYGSAAFVSLGFGISLVFWWSSNLTLTFRVVGIYLIIISLHSLINAISEILLYGTVGAKIKSKVKISLPVFITALLPGRLIDDFNKYFTLNKKEAEKLLKIPKTFDSKECPLEIYIHLMSKGAERTGHVDIRYKDTVYSYGCYDYHSHFMGGVLSDGTILFCDSKKYIDYCLDIEKKVVVGFGISLNEEQKEKIEEVLNDIKSELVEWKTDYENGTADLEKLDPASSFVKIANAKIYKVSKGSFRKYYAINTNCVKLADRIIGVSGLGLISVNGIVVPGAYYSMLNDLFERKDNMVIERNIYKKV